VTREEAEKSAQAFLKRVLGAGESVVFEEQKTSPMQTESYSFYGVLQIPGWIRPSMFNVPSAPETRA
jgi:hypothetical protein